MAAGDFLDAPLGDFLDTIAGEGPAPGGGSVAAIVVAMAAGLVGMVARASKEHWPEAGGVVGQAESFRARVAPLAQADAEVYAQALTALRGRDELEARYRDQKLSAALEQAAEIPLKIAEAGSDLAGLAALLVENGNPEVRADAAAACVLAEGGTRAAAKLVEINLGATDDDPRVRHVRLLVDVAAEAVERAFAAAQ
ncbi:MAG: cyclodeaminase/cyclohydrolase family protein [Actinobacteria bacterium]|nr:MAG: cyclodeaminase/cyclohydrolase family protein [Actinomycetota bacterium]